MLIIMFFREGFNEEPHFHVRYNDYDAKISISDCSILKGKLPTHAFSLIKEWASVHKQELSDNWKRIKNSEPLKKIAPLI